MRQIKLLTIVLMASLVLTTSFAFGGTQVSRGNGTAYTHNEIFDSSVVICGVDVSEWQGKINWELMKSAGVDFAIIRIGGTSYSDGHFYKDSNFETYYKGAKEAGILIGAYFYSQATSEREARDEVRYACSILKGRGLDLPFYMDYEGGGTSKAWLNRANLTKREQTNIAFAFMQEVEANGYDAGFYSYLSYMRGSSAHVYGSEISEKYPVWIAHYYQQCLYKSEYNIWQYSSDGKYRGTQGNTCDLDYLYIEPCSHVDLDEEMKNKRNIGISEVEITDYLLTYVYDESTGYEPKVKVTYEGKTLEEGKDYKVQYFGNYNVGTAYAKVVGIGDYYGYKFAPFSISPSKDTSGLQIQDVYTFTYTGKTISPTKINILEPSGNRITGNLDYTFDNFTKTDVGTYNVKVNLNGNYIGSLNTKIKITKGTQTISIAKQYTTNYTDTKAYNIGVTTKFSGSTITYTSSNKKVATISSKGVITVKGKGTTKITVTASGTKNFTGASVVYTLKITNRPKTEEQETSYTIKRVDLSDIRPFDRLILNMDKDFATRKLKLIREIKE